MRDVEPRDRYDWAKKAVGPLGLVGSNPTPGASLRAVESLGLSHPSYGCQSHYDEAHGRSELIRIQLGGDGVMDKQLTRVVIRSFQRVYEATLPFSCSFALAWLL